MWSKQEKVTMSLELIDGKLYYIDKSTGEMFEVGLHKPGTRHYTPEQQEAYKDKLERERIKALRKANSHELGAFYFASCVEDFSGISPENFVRLLYLCSYLSFSHKELMKTQRTVLKRTELAKILNVSKATVTRFLKEVSDYVEVSDDKVIVNNEAFRVGSLPDKSFIRYQKIYKNNIKSLYEQTDKKYHRQLGYILKLLPFINIEFNILCWNPDEEELDEVEAMTVEELCNMIGYDISNWSRLANILKSVEYDVDGNKERFCAIVSDGSGIKNAKMYVNPHILYSGTDYPRVEVLGAFCKKK